MIRMKNFSLKQLAHFIALAESGSFTAGAELCHLSQAAFSRSIAMLESGLSTSLIDRVGYTNELTPVGRLILEHARHVMAEAEELSNALDVHSGLSGLSLRVGLGSTPNALLSTPLLHHAATLKPTMRLYITQGTVDMQLQALRERKLDALVVELHSVEAATDLSIEHLADLPIGVLCRPGHPLTKLAAPTFEDFTRFPIAGTSIGGEVARRMVAHFGPQAHPSKLFDLCSDDVQYLLEATASSDIVFVGVQLLGQAHLAAQTLVHLNVDTRGFDAPFGLVRLLGRTVPTGLPSLLQIAHREMNKKSLPSKLNQS